MTEYPHYFWKDTPDDGEYELQFDRFETSKGGDHDDLAALLIVDREEDEIVGDVRYPTADVPGIDRSHDGGTAIFRGMIENSELVEMTYDPELTKQRHTEIKELNARLQAAANDESKMK